MKKLLSLLQISLVLSIATPFITNARDLTWTGATSGNWNDSANFSPMFVPTANDTITIDAATHHPRLTSNASAYRLVLLGDTLDLNGYNLRVFNETRFEGGVLLNGELGCRGTLASFNNALVQATVDARCVTLELNESAFSQSCYFEVETGESRGGNEFYASVSLIHVGSGGESISLALENGDTFHDTLYVTNNSDGNIHLTQTDTSHFKNCVHLASTGDGSIHFGREGGIAILEEDGHLVVENGEFTAGQLFIKNIEQQNTTGHRMVLTGTGSSDEHSLLALENCNFSGDVDFTAPNLLLSRSRFEGTAQFTKTGGYDNVSAGDNHFSSDVTFTNSSTTGHLLLTGSREDRFVGTAEFTSGSTKVIAGYGATTIFEGDVVVNSATVGFYRLKFTGEAEQTLSGTNRHCYSEAELDKKSGLVTTTIPVEIDRRLTFTQGYLVTDSVNLITFLASATASGATDSSFVSGPVKKVGNTAFAFPVGKDGHFRPVGISAPDSVTDAFVGEYFDTEQTRGFDKDSTLRFLSPCNHWNIFRTNGSSEIYLSFSYGSSFCDGRPIKPAHIAYWNDSLWVNLGLADTSTGYRITNSPVSMFGDFLIGYAVGHPWEEDINDDCTADLTSTIFTVCGNASQAYNTKYGRVGDYVYIPQASDPEKTIKVFFNIIGDDLGECNFKATVPADLTRLEYIKDEINNSFFSNLQPYFYLDIYNNPTIPVLLPNVSPQPSTIFDSKIRIETTVRFFTSTTLNTSNTAQALFDHVKNIYPDAVNGLNIFFTNGAYFGAGGLATTVQHTAGPNNTIFYPAIVTFRAYSSNGSNYCIPSTIGPNDPNGDWWRAGHLAHEIGHTLGLAHTYISSVGGGHPTCSESFPDYLWDIFGFSSVSPPVSNLCPFPGSTTSNLMDGLAGPNRHISALQLGTMHRALSLGIQRTWIKCEDFTGHHPIIVDQPEVWDFDLKWYGDIHIEAGGEVEMTCKLKMPENARIFVKREGKLRINGALINGDCMFWKGIEVWGDKNESQFPVNGHLQGEVIIENNAEIHDSYDGVYAFKDLGGGSMDADYFGGLIIAKNSKFINNRRAIQLIGYRNFVPGFPTKIRSNRSNFYNCLFETNAILIYPYTDPDCFVYLNDVDIFPVGLNTFRNLRGIGGPFDPKERGIGITVIDSRFKAYQNTFDNLWYGIKADNLLPNHTVFTDNNTFINCDWSVRYSNMSGGHVSRNIMNVPDRWHWGSTYFGAPRGIELENCPSYFVEDNEIVAVSSVLENARYGVVVKDGGVLNNRIYRNYINGFRYAGIQAEGVNAFLDNGLRFLCNRFEDDLKDDIRIVNGPVALTQGFCDGSNGETPARNIFITDVCSNPGNQVGIYASTNPPQLDYSYHSQTSNTFPACTTSTVTTIGCNASINYSTHCPSVFSTSGNQWRTLLQEANVDIANYKMMFDGGHTQWLLDSIGENRIGQYVKDTLLKYSPWISDDILLALVQRAGELDLPSVQQVLDSNSRLPSSVWTYLHQLNNVYTLALIDSLQDKQDRPNESLVTRNWLTQQISERENFLTNLLSVFLTDTLYDEGGLDSALMILEDDHSFEHQNMKYGLLLTTGSFAQADSVLTLMVEMNEDNGYCSLLASLTEYTLGEGGVFAIAQDSALVDSLETLAEDQSRAGMLARNILWKVLGRYYPMLISSPGDEERLLGFQNQQIPGEHKLQESVHHLHPNPTTNRISISRKDGTFLEDLQITLYDISGRAVHQLKVNKPDGIIDFDISHLENGLYMVRITEPNRKHQTIKLVVNK